MAAERRFLFLQGPACAFFARLGRALREAGCEVRRINFNGGDRLFWPLPGAVDYRGGAKGWVSFLEARLDAWAPTDIVLYGDCRPLHRKAVAIAVARGVRIWVVEEGYLRPNWVTVEAGGVNGHSSLPRDIGWYLDAARNLAPWSPGTAVVNSFRRRAFDDVVYNLAAVATAPFYPGFRTHRPWHPFVEYAGTVPRLIANRLGKARAARITDEVVASNTPYFLFPLQLDCDFQIREHSSFKRMAPAIDYVLASFAASAPADARLVVKEHPLDNGLQDWRKLVARRAAHYGVADRVVYVAGGSIETLVGRTRGMVTVNSTSGIVGLAFDCPVIALGSALYDLPRLTFQGPLDRFWEQPMAPDPEAFHAFRRVVAARTQVNGGFFSEPGLALAVEGALHRLTAGERGRRAEQAPVAVSGQAAS